jgi:hypothetical protein
VWLNAALRDGTAGAGTRSIISWVCLAGKPTPAATAGISPTQKFPTLALPAHYNLGHDFTSQDIRITKSFRFKERYEFRLIAEGFNIFNFGNLTGDSFILTSPTFGQPQQRIGQTFGTGGPRAFQFAGRFSFLRLLLIF